MKQISALFLALVISLGFSYGIWRIGRAINYRLSYESMVRETVREMVKREALR